MAPLSSAIKLQQCTRASVSAHKFSLLKDPGDVFVFTERLRQKFGFREGPEKRRATQWGGWRHKEMSSISEEWWVKSLTEDF